MIDQLEAFEAIKKALKQKTNSRQYLINHCGCSMQEANKHFNNYLSYKNNERTGLPTKSNVVYTANDQEATVESGQIKDVDTLLREAKVDLNIWAVDHYIVNKWESASKNDLKEVVVTPLWQIKVWLKKKENADTAKELIEWFKDEIGAAVPKDKWDKVKLVKQDTRKKYCLELAIPDLHVGKLAHGEEIDGLNYDSNEAVRIFKLAVNDLILKAPMNLVEKILFVVGNDFYHSDNALDTTTAGTKMDVDSRWTKTFRKGCSLLKETLTELGNHYPVDVLLVAGNHDMERNFYLGEYLSAFFKSHPNVSINNEPTARKYYQYGKNLLGFTHGNNEKPNKLPLIMATERPNEWAECKFKEWHLGHLHKESNEEFMGTKVRYLPSLCGIDAWHYSRGYIGTIRAALAFLYDFDKGLEAIYYFNL